MFCNWLKWILSRHTRRRLQHMRRTSVCGLEAFQGLTRHIYCKQTWVGGKKRSWQRKRENSYASGMSARDVVHIRHQFVYLILSESEEDEDWREAPSSASFNDLWSSNVFLVCLASGLLYVLWPSSSGMSFAWSRATKAHGPDEHATSWSCSGVIWLSDIKHVKYPAENLTCPALACKHRGGNKRVWYRWRSNRWWLVRLPCEAACSACCLTTTIVLQTQPQPDFNNSWRVVIVQVHVIKNKSMEQHVLHPGSRHHANAPPPPPLVLPSKEQRTVSNTP